MMPRRHVLPLLKAAAIAAAVLVRRGRFRRLFWQAVDMVRSVFSYRYGWNPMRTIHFAERRMDYCRYCTLFDDVRQTFGTASLRKDSWFHSPVTGRLEPWGCWCYLPVKTATDCNCWLYERTNGAEGWPEELNSYPL